MKKIKVAVIYSSCYGHTKLMAAAVAKGVAEANADVLLLTADEAVEKLAALDSVDAIIIGSPTYMGNISSEVKHFMEKSVSRWFSRSWQDKIAGGFTCSSNFSGDKHNTLHGIFTFAMQMGMIWVGEGDVVASNVPGAMSRPEGPGVDALNRNSASIGPMSCSFELKAGEAPGPGDIATSENYGRRVAKITAKLYSH